MTSFYKKFVLKSGSGCLSIFYWIMVGWWLVPAVYVAELVWILFKKLFNFVSEQIVVLSEKIEKPVSLKIGKLVTSSFVVTLIGFCCLCNVIYSQTPAAKASAQARAMTQTANVTSTPTGTNTPLPSSTPEPTATTTSTPTLTNTPLPTETPNNDQVLATLSGMFACVPQNEIEKGKVVEVIDGDTIDVEINGEVFRLRYIGMDTPEMSDQFGEIAKEKNIELVYQKEITLIKDVSETDPYDRLLRYVFVGDQFINYQLVLDGYATAKAYPPDTACNEFFSRSQLIAESNQIGIWEVQESTITPVAGNTGKIQIVYIYYDTPTEKEPDEYVEITNVSQEEVNLSGWKLYDLKNHTFYFPNYTMQPGQTCRIYTNEYHEEYCGFNYGSSGSAIWNNSGGDTATLKDNTGAIVDQRSY